MDDLSAYVTNICPTSVLLPEALRLSLHLNHPVADCLYLACARYLGATLISADRKFLDKCGDNYRAYYAPLETWSPPEMPADQIIDFNLDLVTKLSALRSTYEQTKRHAFTRPFEHELIVGAEERLLRVLARFDVEELSHVTAFGWLGALDPHSQDDKILRQIWLQYLDSARALWGHSRPRGDLMPDILISLGHLNAGLRYLPRLGGQTPNPRNV